jgi:hydroxyacylglutathione hydrolase
MARLDLIPVIDAGLGNSTYILDLGDGNALVVDPERDVREVREHARRLGLSIAYAAETHLHADFISGVRELADAEGATVLAPEVGPREFPSTVLRDGDTLRIGTLQLQAIGTPGHSPEHLSYLILDEARVAGVFTGGSLMVGTAGRTDLVSAEQTIPLARAQYHSLHRLMELPDETQVWPTHGAGSFCSAAPGTDRVTTIGRERATNPLLQVHTEDAFVEALLASLGTFPDYFLRLGGINRRGPSVLGAVPPPAPLSAESVRTLQATGATVIDVRPPADFAGGHIPGSVSNTLRPAFATWLGWLTNPGQEVVIVRNADQESVEIAWEAAKVGFDALCGELEGGMDAWTESGLGTVSLPLTPPHGLSPARPTLDVRQAAEFAAWHVPDAVNIELGSLSGNLSLVPHGAVTVMCGHGERAMTAASILTARGRSAVSVLDGGPADLRRSAETTLRAPSATR